jgi:hypothetical protein
MAGMARSSAEAIPKTSTLFQNAQSAALLKLLPARRSSASPCNDAGFLAGLSG